MPCTCRCPTSGANWLSPGRALDIPFDHDPVQVLERARQHFAGQPVDVNVVPAANRRKKLLIADMDSTIINCECLDELADMAGLKAQVSAITERAMRGELEFDDGAARTRRDAEGPAARGAGARLCRAHPAQSRREDAASPPCASMARIRCWCPAASPTSPRAWRRTRAFDERPGQRPARRRRGADRPGARSDPRPRSQARGAGKGRAPILASTPPMRSRSATAPTIWR